MAGYRWFFAAVVLALLCKGSFSLPVSKTGDLGRKEIGNDVIQDLTSKEQEHDISALNAIQRETDENYIDLAYGFDDDDDEVVYDDFPNDVDDDEDDMIARLFQLRGRGRGRKRRGGGGGGGGGGYNWQQYAGPYYKRDKNEVAQLNDKD